MRDWVDSIEALRSLDPQAKSTLRAGAQQIRAPKDTVLFRPGDRCKLFPIIVQGVVRVQRIAESGRQLVRSWVFQGYGQRIAQLMSKIEEIACKRIDVRLAAHLLALAG